MVQFSWHPVHLDSIHVRQKTYHLAAYPMFDVNYGVYECDQMGLLCRSVYKSGDYLGPEAMRAHFAYDEMNGSLSVVVDAWVQEEPIYSHKPP
jgi:hypothetical protein